MTKNVSNDKESRETTTLFELKDVIVLITSVIIAASAVYTNDKRITVLETRYNSFAEINRQMSTQVRNMVTEVSRLSSAAESLSSSVDDLTENVSSKDESIRQLSGEIRLLKYKVELLQGNNKRRSNVN